MIKSRIYHFFIFLLVSLLMACYSSKSSFNYDYTYLYDESQKLIKPEFKIFHTSQDSSYLYYQLKSTDILYGRDSGDTLLKANIWVKYRVFSDFNKKEIIDSATLRLVNYGSNEKSKILQGKIALNIPLGIRCPIELRFRDENKDLNVIYSQIIDKRENYNNQFFIMNNGNKVVITPNVDSFNKITIKKSSLVKKDTFDIQLSEEVQPITPPPFASQENVIKPFKIDSFFTVVFQNNFIEVGRFKHVNRLIPKGSQIDDCLYYFQFYPGYPNVVGINQLVEPIRYISTSSEYRKVTSAVNTKKAVDAFWLKLGKTQEKAKKMIAAYYGRVELANNFFSSYKEGWKTDRGIIYVIYGKPTTVYKTIDKETWIYGEENNILSVKFNFIRNNDFRSDNAFELIRNIDYKNNWYRAVDMWRQAKVY